MKRKLVKQGASTMMVSLPAKWIKKQGLSKGDEIDIEEEKGKLEVTTEKNLKQKRKTAININKENKDDIKNILTHAYRKGFDKIILKGDLSGLKIKSTIRKLLLGFESTETNDNKVVLENISEPSHKKYNLIQRKTFQIVKETQKSTVQGFEENNFDKLKELEDFKNQQDRFVLFCRRILSKREIEKNPLLEWELFTFLMHIQHAYYYLYKYASENKVSKDKTFLSLLKFSQEYFEFYEDAYVKENIGSIHKINSLKMKYQFGKCLKELEKSKGKSTVLFSYLREIFRIIQIGTSPILAGLLEEEEEI